MVRETSCSRTPLRMDSFSSYDRQEKRWPWSHVRPAVPEAIKGAGGGSFAVPSREKIGRAKSVPA